MDLRFKINIFEVFFVKFFFNNQKLLLLGVKNVYIATVKCIIRINKKYRNNYLNDDRAFLHFFNSNIFII